MASRNDQPACSACPLCGAVGVRFAHNGTRERACREVVEGMVAPVPAGVTRWKCPACRRSFPEYPPGVLPFKRFTRETVYRLCMRYLGDPDATYRGVVCEDGIPIAYPEPEGVASGFDDDGAATPMLAHTTVHRWLTTLGRDIAPEDCPSSTETDGPPSEAQVAPSKFRSEARRAILARCCAVLRRRSVPHDP